MIATPKKNNPLFWMGLSLPVVALMAMHEVIFAAREEQERALSKHQEQAADEVMSTQLMSIVLIVAVAVALALVEVILLRLEKLQEFVTACAWTGRVRFEGQGLRLDEYLDQQFNISVSHSLSQEAAEKMRIEIEELNRAGYRSLQTSDK